LSPELFPRKELAPEFDGWRNAAAGSLIFHLLLFIGLALVPPTSEPRPVRPERKKIIRVTKLYDPPVELTQKAPNKQPLSKELSVETVLPHPSVKAPAPAPQARKRFSPAPAEVAKEVPKPQPVIQAPPEAPKIELPKETPKVPAVTAQTPPQPPPQEKPKLAFQAPKGNEAPVTAGPANPKFNAPSIDQAVRNLAHGESQGGQSVGDSVADLTGAGPGLNLPPSAGRPLSSLELKSDPLGVDFKPYLIRVLATVRRNWFAIYPETARLGTRGKVVVKFSVSKDGSIPKVVYSAQSGSRPLDEAAVAALSASNPLPPLPPEFKGQIVVLEFTFSYNIPTR
jgi:TonB family protein